MATLRNSGVASDAQFMTPPSASNETSAEIREAFAVTASALKMISQQGGVRHARKLKLTQFKCADDSNHIDDIMYRWESEFESANLPFSVAVIINEGMHTGHALYVWAMSH